MKIKCRSCCREFVITNPKQKFCSNNCAQKFYYDTHKAEKKKYNQEYYEAHKDERRKYQRKYSAKQRAEKRKAGVKR